MPAETIAGKVDQDPAEFSGPPMRTFIPVLTQKRVMDHLRRARSA